MSSHDTPLNKTQRALVYAILSLLEQETFSKITVNDICEEALISRSSFYTYYQDKYDLLQSALRELKTQLQAKLAGHTLEENLEAFLAGIQEKRTVILRLLEDATNAELREMLMELIIEDFAQALGGMQAAIGPQLPVEVNAAFYAGGLTSLLFWWARNRFAMPKKELAGHIMVLMEQACP